MIFNQFKLGEISTIKQKGGTPDKLNAEYWSGDLPWLTSGETSNMFITETKNHISKEAADSKNLEIVPKGSLVIARSGQGCTRGQTSLCLIDTYVNDGLITIIPDNTKVLPRYLLYNLIHRYDEIRQLSDSNSCRGNINATILSNLNIMLPELEVQKNIVNLVSKFDDLILINNRINDYLGKLAREMFEHEANMYDTVTMSLSKCTLINKGSLSSKTHDQVFHYLDTGNITNNYVKSYQRFRYEELPSRARRLVKEGDVVYSTVRPNQLHFGLLISVPENCVVSTGFAVIRSKDSRISNEIIYLSLTSSNVIEYLQGIAESSTSTYPSITSNDLGNIEVPIISDNIQKTLKLIFKIINSNQCQNRILNDLRERILEFLLKRNSDK